MGFIGSQVGPGPQQVPSTILNLNSYNLLEMSKNKIRPDKIWQYHELLEAKWLPMDPNGSQRVPMGPNKSQQVQNTILFTDSDIKLECSKSQAGPKVGPNGSQGVPMGPSKWQWGAMSLDWFWKIPSLV